jgi:hypothetical protein
MEPLDVTPIYKGLLLFFAIVTPPLLIALAYVALQLGLEVAIYKLRDAVEDLLFWPPAWLNIVLLIVAVVCIVAGIALSAK